MPAPAPAPAPAPVGAGAVVDHGAAVRKTFSQTDQHFLFVGTVGMALGAIVFMFFYAQAKAQKSRLFYIINFFICSIAALAYFAMASGYGVMLTPHKRSIFWARYIDWVLTTPLLLLDLALIVRANTDDTTLMVVADVLMIVTGLVGALVPAPYKYVWWALGMLFFFIIVNKLFQLMEAASRTLAPAASDVFKALSWVTIILWSGYPIIWILGGEGTNSMSQKAEVGCITMLDLAAKVGFGLYLLFNLDAIHADEGYSETAALRPQEE